MVANWRLKTLKAVAAANPIETLENQYADREQALLKIRENIKEFHAVVAELWSQIQEHNEKYPDRPSQFVEKYTKMKALLALRSDKYKQAQANLKSFGELIEEKRSDWKVAQSAAKAMKLANVGEDFQAKLMQDTALSTITDGLNMAFSELEVSLLDEDKSTPAQVTVGQSQTSTGKSSTQLAEKAGPPTLDLVFDESSPIMVNNRQKVATS
jgi:molecular chaperone GrpE (heat shock protein)